MRKALIVCAAIAAVVAAPSAGQPQGAGADRLAAFGRVWLTVKFSHPRVALSDRDWDRAVADVLPGVTAADDDAAFADAVGAMLAALGDPVTRVERRPGDAQARQDSGRPAGSVSIVREAGALLVDLRAAGALSNAPVLRKTIEANLEAIKQADRLVVDLRGTGREGFAAGAMFGTLQDLLVGEPTALPASRSVMHSGYRAQAGGASFYSSQHTIEAATLVTPRQGIGPRRVAFVVDRDAVVPRLALALQSRGTGAVLVQGDPVDTPVAIDTVPLGGDFEARIRVTDLVLDGRRVELVADATVPAGETDAVVHARAAELIGSPRAPRSGTNDPAPVWKPESDYADAPYPSEAHRLIAVYRMWGIIDAFFPYKHLLDKPWDGVLAEFAPRALAAKDELEYAQVMAQMAARTQDSHVGVTGSKAMTKWLGEAPVPFAVRFVEGKPVVTRIVDGQAAAGIQPGDEILTVDGESVDARAQRIESHITFSTKAGRDRTIAGRLLHGDPGSRARLEVRGADGKVRQVSAERDARFSQRAQRDGDVIKMLDGNVGYADLDRLEAADVPKVFELFKDTVGIIFDMRGYPRGTAWAIAPRINTRKPTAAALFYRPLLVGGSGRERLSFEQGLPPTTTEVYSRPTVMLIDERAISQAEHTGLFFKAANNTTFVGSSTIGANGDVTTFLLPGGLRVSFTGHDVRWPDGRQLQRIGLVPDVEIRPTIAGIREGRDEVLEKGVAYLRGLRTSSASKRR